MKAFLPQNIVEPDNYIILYNFSLGTSNCVQHVIIEEDLSLGKWEIATPQLSYDYTITYEHIVRDEGEAAKFTIEYDSTKISRSTALLFVFVPPQIVNPFDHTHLYVYASLISDGTRLRSISNWFRLKFPFYNFFLHSYKKWKSQNSSS